MTQAFEDRRESETPNEEIETQRKLRFVIYLAELAKTDPKWKQTLKEKAESFKVIDQ